MVSHHIRTGTPLAWIFTSLSWVYRQVLRRKGHPPVTPFTFPADKPEHLGSVLEKRNLPAKRRHRRSLAHAN